MNRIVAGLAAILLFVLVTATDGAIVNRVDPDGATRPPASASIRGSLLMVDPVGGRRHAEPGVIILRGRETYAVRVPATGSFVRQLSPGTYAVDVRLPALPAPIGVQWSPHTVTVPARAVHVSITAYTDAG